LFQAIERRVRCNPVDPCAEAGLLPECPDGAIDFHEDFLHDVFRIVVVVHETKCEVVDSPHMQLDKFSKRFMASLLRFNYQLPLPVSGH
jgi:hypothetical protein